MWIGTRKEKPAVREISGVVKSHERICEISEVLVKRAAAE
jgi:hypothetical protein